MIDIICEKEYYINIVFENCYNSKYMGDRRMNQIIKHLLNDHINEYSISSYEEDMAFEHFINRCIVTKYTTERFDPSDIMTDPGEIGIDGIAIIINDQLVTSLDEAQVILSEQNSKDIKFIFTQAKRSDHFDGAEMSQFTKGVKHFFEKSNVRPKTNDKMETLISIKDYIYSQTINYDYRPTLILRYVCCGIWNANNNLQNTIEQDKLYFKNTSDFESVDYQPYDQNQIITLCKELRRKIQKEFIMEKRMSFSEMPGIKEAYFGLVKCIDIVSMLTDEQGKLFNNIFEDNVRDFQGYNSVNSEIQATIRDETEQKRFAVLNNGITIIAREIKTEGDKIRIFDYQIVNGCQTSHVLFENQKHLHPFSYILTKIICVENEDVLDKIVYTSNRQTEVKYEAFASANRFHKMLQEYYNSIDVEYRLFYERRSKQYDLDVNIDKNKIISLATQTKIYLSMFLNEPHSVHRYYGEILDSYKNRIYSNGDYQEPYYTAAYILYLVDLHFKNNRINRNLKSYKYHLCYVIRVLTVGNKISYGNSKDIKKYADKLLELAKDESAFNRCLNTACTCVEKCIASSKDIKDGLLLRSKEFTKRLAQTANDYVEQTKSTTFLKKGAIVQCQITSIRPHNVEVTLKTDDSRKKGSIHISKIADHYIDDIHDEVKFGDIVQAKLISDYNEYPFGWSLSMLPCDIK